MLNLKIKRYRLIAFIISLLVHILVLVVLINQFVLSRPNPIQTTNKNLIPIQNIQPMSLPPPTPPTNQTKPQNTPPTPTNSPLINTSRPTPKPTPTKVANKATPKPTPKPTGTATSKPTAKPTPKPTPVPTATLTPTPSAKLTPTPKPTPTLDTELTNLKKYDYFAKWDDSKLRDLKKQITNNEIPGVKTIEDYVKLTQQVDQSYDWTKVPPRTGGDEVTSSPGSSPTPKLTWREVALDDSSNRITFQTNDTFFIINWTNGDSSAHVTYYPIAPTPNPSGSSKPVPSPAVSGATMANIKSFDIPVDADRDKFIDSVLQKYQEQAVKAPGNSPSK